MLLARLGLTCALAAAIAIPVASYTVARRLALVGEQSHVPNVKLSSAEAATYAQAASNQAATLVVLGYDDVVSKSPASAGSRTVQAADLAAQLAMLKAAGFVSVTSDQVNSYLVNGGGLPANAVLLTFDGGRQRNWSIVDGILAKYGFSAVVSVDPELVGDRRSTYLSWTQLQSMVSSGRWSLGLDISSTGDTVAINAAGLTGPALLEHAWLPSGKRVETTEEYQARIRSVLEHEESLFAPRNLPSPQLVEYPFKAGYPLDRVTATFNELTSVVNSIAGAGILSVQPDSSVTSTYRSERLLPMMQVYRETSTDELFARIESVRQ